VVPSGHPQGYQDAFNAFVADSYAAVAGQSPDGLPRFEDGLRAVRITELGIAELAAIGAAMDARVTIGVAQRHAVH